MPVTGSIPLQAGLGRLEAAVPVNVALLAASADTAAGLQHKVSCVLECSASTAPVQQLAEHVHPKHADRVLLCSWHALLPCWQLRVCA